MADTAGSDDRGASWGRICGGCELRHSRPDEQHHPAPETTHVYDIEARCADRRERVTVDIRAVDEANERVEHIRDAPTQPRRAGEFEEQDAPAAPRDPAYLIETAPHIGNRAKHEGRRHGIELSGAKGEMLRVHLREGKMGRRELRRPPTCLPEHRCGEVYPDECSPVRVIGNVFSRTDANFKEPLPLGVPPELRPPAAVGRAFQRGFEAVVERRNAVVTGVAIGTIGIIGGMWHRAAVPSSFAVNMRQRSCCVLRAAGYARPMPANVRQGDVAVCDTRLTGGDAEQQTKEQIRMVDDALCWLPATELAALIRARTLSPVEVTEAVLARIHRLNGATRAYITVADEYAMRAAQEAEAAVLRGDPLGVLHGVPVSVKDLSYTKGIRTTRGSLLFADFVPDEDHPIVDALKMAGAVIVGKTNTPEFGWKGATDNRLGPPAVNPWDAERTPGGSSGGGAAAVAMGMAPLATGSDAVCSIRTPASFCGIFGLKPQFGRVPTPVGGLDVAHLGPMARTVRDGALMLSAMGVPHEGDRLSLPDSGTDWVAACDGGIAGLRVAWSADFGYLPVDPEVRAITTRAAAQFAALGCTLEEAHPGFTDPAHAIDVFFHGLIAGRYAPFVDDPAARVQMDPELLATLQARRGLDVGEIMAAEVEREELWQHCRRFFGTYDLLITPTVAVPPFALNRFHPAEIDGKPTAGWQWTAFTYPFNLTGQPAATVPCGWTADGLPVGLQIVGRRYAEATVLRAAAAWETAHPWADCHPPDAA